GASQGDDTIAYMAISGGHMILNNTSATTTGARATGVWTSGANTVVDLENGTVISTSGIDAHGLQLFKGGTIKAVDTTIAVTGAGASAIVFEDSAAVDDGLVHVTGGSLSSTHAPLISVVGGDGTM